MRKFLAAALAVFLFLPAGARAWEEPARGTPTRAALMDALRPHAVWLLGAPVQFVVYDLRRDGDLAFASVGPQRPGGLAIDLWKTPGARRGELAADMMDGVSMQALYVRSGKTWVAVHWAIGATDVWWSQPELCRVWRPVIAQACQGF